MKDATGELSMTAVAVVAIAAIGVVFTTLVWPAIRSNILRSTYCSQTVRCDAANENGMAVCYYCPTADNNNSNDIDTNGVADCADTDLKTITCSMKQQGASA